jgi:hypothetical protein
MDFEYDLKDETPNIFSQSEKEPLITEKTQTEPETETEMGIKRKHSHYPGSVRSIGPLNLLIILTLGTFSSAGLSTASSAFTFQQTPKNTQPYVSGLGNPFLFAMPKSTPSIPPVPEATSKSLIQRKISHNAVLRARKRRAKEDLFGSGFRKKLSEIADEHEDESMSDSDNETIDQHLDTSRHKSSDTASDNDRLHPSLTATVNGEYWNASQRDYAYIMSGYIQTGFNLFVVLVLMYLALQVILTIQRDVQQKVTEYSACKWSHFIGNVICTRLTFVHQAILKEIAVCTKLYEDNRCLPKDRVPAMDEACRNWETCINRDPLVIGR